MSSTHFSPFIEAHRIGPLEFNISSPVKPISIRDQMVRAEMLIDDLWDGALISKPRRLLIVGGGVAATTAALCAIRHKVPVLVVNKASSFFTLQAKCFTRWIDPTQYDWPAGHWRMAKYPWHQPGMGAPLPWDAQIASTIATDWSVTMDYADRTHPNLTVWHEHELAGLPTYDATQETMDCEIRDLVSGTVSDVTVGCVLYAVGFGRERSAIGSFQSEYFWQADSLESPQAGCSANPAATISVAICGAGDGALQDFIRVVTGMHSAGELMDVVLPYLERQHELEIASEEEQAQRALLWCQDKADEHKVCSRLHDIHQRIVDDMLTNTGISAELSGLLDARLANLTVTIYHPCDHFSPSFALNRFLVHLLCAWAQRRGASIHRVPRRMLKLVAGIGHTCSRDDMDACRCKRHRLNFNPDATCVDSRGVLHREDADLVVLRLGIEPLKFLPLDGREMRFSRQILPYFPPQQ